jgi:nucleotide-binding universal stress UspA family protein
MLIIVGLEDTAMFFERVCIATDGSDLAVRAAQMGVVLARAGAGRVLAVSVAQPFFFVPAGDTALPDAGAELLRARQAAQAHTLTVERIARDGAVSCDAVTPLASAPGPAIIAAAQAHGCDLIIMGTHGPNDANRLFTGSTAQYVLAHSAIPVLLLRDPGECAPPDFQEPPLP